MFCCCADSESAARSRAAEDVILADSSEKEESPPAPANAAEETGNEVAGDALAEKGASSPSVPESAPPRLSTTSKAADASKGEKPPAVAKPITVREKRGCCFGAP